MSLNSERTSAARIMKEISDLRSKEAAESKKEAGATKKVNSSMASAQRATSLPSASMHQRAAAAETKNIEASQQRRARHSADIAKKSQELVRVQDRIARGEEVLRKADARVESKRRQDDDKSKKALEAETKRLRRDYEARVASLEAQIAAQVATQASSTPSFKVAAAEGQTVPYDFFISHAWADKAEFVDVFVKKAEAAGLKVWYDKFAMRWGDSLRQKIDEGLRSAYFGVVILSPNFFERPWPNYELDGILQRDLSGQGRLLPIWHRLTQDDVEKHAPSLAGRLALSTAVSSSDAIVQELIIARDSFKAALS